MRKLRVFAVALFAFWPGCSRSETLPEKRAALPQSTTVAERGIGDFPNLSAEHDWPWWRGPQRNGHAHPAARPPTTWSERENVVWRAPVPGRGHSSPTVVGSLVVLTTADEAKQVQSVVALDRATGRQRWKTDVSRGGFPRAIHSHNTHATPTVACDGERLIACFFHHATVQATALDFEGKQLWQTTLGPFNPQRYEYGYAPSPFPFKNTFIVASEYDGDSFFAAFDLAGGKEVWRTKRPNNISFSTPVVAHVRGHDQLLASGAETIASYDPDTGEELWATQAMTAATCGTMVWDGDLVFASGGYPKSVTCCVRADGLGEVVWTNTQKCYEQSLIVVDGYVYALTDKGVLYCWRGTDGREMWKERLKGPVSCSPVYAGGHIYWSVEAGTTFVFRPNPERFEAVATNQLGDESYASPAAVDDRLYLRAASRTDGVRQEWLYCLGVK